MMYSEDSAMEAYRLGLNLYPIKKDEQMLSPEEIRAHYFVADEKKKFDVEATSNRFRHLLSITPLFKHFLKMKASNDENFSQVLQSIENEPLKTTTKRRRTEKEEDAELMRDEENENTPEIVELDKEGEFTDSGYEFTKSPKYINGTLRQYQIQGLNWLVSLNTNDLSGILADEMGLGKTLQTISFLGYLRYIKSIKGPHIVIVPKSTLENWQREFAKWTPEVRTCVLTGDQETRNQIIKDKILTCDFDVLISSYEIVIREKSTLKKINWQYIVVDEAHRLKNEDSLLSQIIRMFHSKNRLLITGTPLQNNLHELWALLNFILPDVFADSATFDDWFSNEEENKSENGTTAQKAEGDKEKVVQQLHQVLKPFLLRRIKNDVEKSLLPKQELNIYVDMTPMQKRWYQKILEKDIDAINGANGKKESKTRLLNIVMQLRKCCNHPYLFEGAEPGPPFTTDEHLIFNSQKMLVLDKLLKKLREQGSRVLIFSQMSRMLDILEDYCGFREWGYCRIDGQTEHSERISAIDEYNKEGSEKFVFLLTTRAGGLGINLTSADVVVLFDSDWNPQADLQAMDRAHRIGQKKQVKVFRFVTENAIEEKVLERASQKLRLDQLVIQQGRGASNVEKKSNSSSKDELLNMIQHGAADVLMSQSVENSSTSHELNDDELERILMKSEEKTGELKSKFSKLGLDDLQNFTNSDSVYEWDGKNFQKKDLKTDENVIKETYMNWITSSKRERKSNNYSVDGYYREVLQTGGRVSNAAAAQAAANGGNNPHAINTALKPPKHLVLYDHQFYDDELYELYELEWAYYKRVCKIPANANNKKLEAEDLELEQSFIDHARPLTEEEEERKKELLEKGFGNWTKRDFYSFINANARHGRYDIERISADMEDKTYEEVLEYSEKFWSNYRDIDNYDRYIQTIETGEEKIIKMQKQQDLLKRKVSQYEYPLRDMDIKVPYVTIAKREWSEFEDRWLVLQMLKIGIDKEDLYERIYSEIQYYDHDYIEMDWWLQTRNVQEIARRGQSLLAAITKEHEQEKKARLAKIQKMKNEKAKKMSALKNAKSKKVTPSRRTSKITGVKSTSNKATRTSKNKTKNKNNRSRKI